MNKIFTDLSKTSDITELLIFMDKHHPEIMQECVLSKQEEKSFFIHFSYGIYHNIDKIKSVYELNKKYGYDFKNTLNKNENPVNDLYDILSFNNCHDQFIIYCLNALSLEERIKTIVETDLLLNSFKNNKIEVLKELSNYPEVWNNKTQLTNIQNNYLNNFELSEIYAKNILPDNTKIVTGQSKDYIKKELQDISKYNADDKIEKIKKYIGSMLKKDQDFSIECKEEIVGLSLLSPITKVTSQLIKLLFNDKLSTYKPSKPLWMHFENLKNKDILYDFLEKFNFQDYYQDNLGVKHYKVDYLEKALTSMDVKLEENVNLYRTDNKSKRDGAISNIVLPLLKDYWLTEVDGKIGYTREVLKQVSKLNNQVNIVIPVENVAAAQNLLEKTILYQENGSYVFIEKIEYQMGRIKNLKKIFEENLIPQPAIKKIVENFTRYNLDIEILDLLKQYIVNEKMVLDLDKLLEIKKQIWGYEKKMLEELEQMNKYNIAYNRHEKMQNKYEAVPENKTKRVKI